MYRMEANFYTLRNPLSNHDSFRVGCLGRLVERRVGVGEELDKVGLEPLASLRGRLEGIRQAAVGVVADGTGVAGAVALTTGLDPDKGVEQVVAGVGRRAQAEASADSVAPVTPFGLTWEVC